jgi:hypothetical protein
MIYGPLLVYQRGIHNFERHYAGEVRLPVKKGSRKSETLKYGRRSQGTRTRERLRGQEPAAHTKDRPVFSSERAPHGIKNVTVRRIPYSVRK